MADIARQARRRCAGRIRAENAETLPAHASSLMPCRIKPRKPGNSILRGMSRSPRCCRTYADRLPSMSHHRNEHERIKP